MFSMPIAAFAGRTPVKPDARREAVRGFVAPVRPPARRHPGKSASNLSFRRRRGRTAGPPG